MYAFDQQIFQPNCYIQIHELVGRDFQVWVHAKRNVKVGEELTYDYQDQFNGVIDECNCGSKRYVSSKQVLQSDLLLVYQVLLFY